MRHTHETLSCPDRETWSGFYAGRTDPAELPVLGEHLDDCPACQAVLGALCDTTADEADVLVAGLRAVTPGADPFEGEAECRRALEQVQALVPAADWVATPAVPERLGEYRVLGRIGRGGMGAVYRAVHARLGREVALKVVPPERARDAAALARFRRETSALGKLDHPNVVRATDAGEEGGVTYLVMDLVDGLDLAGLVQRCGALRPADAAELARQAAAGLQHLNAHGLVHRDVKPSNLMLDRRGDVKVLDLGLASAAEWADGAEGLTGSGQVVGTFDYLAPEQADPGHPVDGRADVYGLGCSLFFLLAGRPPYSGPRHATARSKILAHTAAPVPAVREVRSDVPAGLSAVLGRMMAKDPADRFPTPAAAATALAPYCAGHDLPRLLATAGLEPLAPVTRATAAESTPPVASRRPRVAAALALVAVLALAGGLAAAIRTWVFPTPADPGPDVAAVPPASDPPPQPAPAGEKKDPPAEAAKEEAKPVHPVALLGFEDRGAKDVGAKVADLLFAKLSAKPEFYLVDRTDLKKILDEQQLNLSGAVRADEAVQVGQLTGAKILVTGSVVQVEKKLHLIAKVIGTETGRVVAASVEGVASDDLGVLAGQLADEVEKVIAKQAEKLVPKPAPAADRVAELVKKLGKAPRPVVAVSIPERHIGQPAADPAAQTEVTRYATGAGFEVIDPDEGGRSRADVFLTGEGFSEVAGRVGGLVSVRARVELKAVDRRTGKVLAADRQVAVVVGPSEQVAGKEALQQAAADLTERVLPKLVAPEKKK